MEYFVNRVVYIDFAFCDTQTAKHQDSPPQARRNRRMIVFWATPSKVCIMALGALQEGLSTYPWGRWPMASAGDPKGRTLVGFAEMFSHFSPRTSGSRHGRFSSPRRNYRGGY